MYILHKDPDVASQGYNKAENSEAICVGVGLAQFVDLLDLKVGFTLGQETDILVNKY